MILGLACVVAVGLGVWPGGVAATEPAPAGSRERLLRDLFCPGGPVTGPHERGTGSPAPVRTDTGCAVLELANMQRLLVNALCPGGDVTGLRERETDAPALAATDAAGGCTVPLPWWLNPARIDVPRADPYEPPGPHHDGGQPESHWSRPWTSGVIELNRIDP